MSRVMFVAVLLAGGVIIQPGANVFAQYRNFQKLDKVQSIDLMAEAVSSTSARLSWRINHPAVIGGIRIYRAHPVMPDNFVFVLNLPANAVTFTDTGLKAGSTWIYRIQTSGKKPVQLSTPSNPVQVKLPAPGPDEPASQNTGGGSPQYTTEDPSIESVVKSLAARAIGPNDIELVWAIPNLPHVSSLRVFRTLATEPGNFALVGAVGSHLKSYVDTNLQPNTTYLYQLKYNKDSHGIRLSPPSNTASARTLNGPAPNLRAKAAANRPKPGILFQINNFGYGNAIPLDALEEELLYQLNQYRAVNGLGPVRASVSLCQSSETFGKELAQTGGGAPGTKYDSFGRSTLMRARAAGFDVMTKFDTVVITAKADPATVLEGLKASTIDNPVLLDPVWKIVGISRNYSESDGGYRWVLDFAAYWDKTIPLPGEDTDGRIDGNEGVRTRPPSDALALSAKFTGYGDDGKPYSAVHCDLETKECWKDPVMNLGRSLNELSLPENMIGDWHVQYQFTQGGAWHFNDPDRFDTTEFQMSLKLNQDGTWISQGYRAYQTPAPSEAGTWKWVHDAARNEELITFYREGRPTATIRVHAAEGEMTFFAIDGGNQLLNFFRGVAGDRDKTDDPQVVFKPGLTSFSDSFPFALRCTTCPLPVGGN
ncbi:MAG: CAP domain-containing protein [Blastocatellia bacterium]